MKKIKKRCYINFKTVKRNILIILFILAFIKYCSFMSSYNKKVFAEYPTRDETQMIVSSSTYYKNINK